jgi:hypothetical protein
MAQLRQRRSIALAVLGMNLLLWMYFWVHFFAISAPHNKFTRDNYDSVPKNIVLWREAGIEASLSPHRILQLVCFPSWYVAHTVANSAVQHQPSLRDAEFLGTSAGGAVLIATMLLTFAQWYLVARITSVLIIRFIPVRTS